MIAFLIKRKIIVWMTREEIEKHKEAYRLFWIVKGHFASHETIIESQDGYFKRLWGNHENVVHEEGFEEAFETLLESMYDKDNK